MDEMIPGKDLVDNPAILEKVVELSARRTLASFIIS